MKKLLLGLMLLVAPVLGSGQASSALTALKAARIFDGTSDAVKPEKVSFVMKGGSVYKRP